MENVNLPVPVETLMDMIDKRDKAIELVHIIKNAKEELDSIHCFLDSRLERETRYEIDASEKIIDYLFWKEAIDKCKITDLMTEKKKYEYLDKLEKNAPHFCEQEIYALFQNINSIYGENLEATIIEVYEQLINCRYNGNGYKGKRDNLQKIEKQFRISGNIYWDRWWGSFHYQSSMWGLNYEDLHTACYLLDGRGRPKYHETFENLCDQQLKKQKKSEVETDYFKMKCHLNGNQKLTWNPEKCYILDRLNQVGADKALPDTMRKRYKKEHFE